MRNPELAQKVIIVQKQKETQDPTETTVIEQTP